AKRSSAMRGRALIAAGGALLLVAAVAVAVVELAGGGGIGLRAAPDSVAAIDTHTNRVVGQVPVGARPGGIAFGAGSLCVANLDDQTVSRIDPTALGTVRTLAVVDPPTGIAATSRKIWVVGSNTNATSVTVRRIDPEF